MKEKASFPNILRNKVDLIKVARPEIERYLIWQPSIFLQILSTNSLYKYYKNITNIALPYQLSLQIKGKKTFSRSNLCHNSRKIEGAKLQGGFDSPHITGESLSLSLSLSVFLSLSLSPSASGILTLILLLLRLSLFSFLLFFVILQCKKACLHVNNKCRPSILILLRWTKTCVVKIISTYCVAVRVGYSHFPVL